MVTLATCDSGAQGSILTPGGSLAYDLHVAGIPWVIASQFPLSKRGSTILTRELYPRIWRGDDPREALFEVRRFLFTHVDQMHDWASLVIYASLPKDFDSQVTQFFETQTRAAINTAMKHADNIFAAPELKGARITTQGLQEEIKPTLKKVEEYLEIWEKRLPVGTEISSRRSRTQFYGISGSVYKRIALLYKNKMSKNGKSSPNPKTYLENIRKALTSYDQGSDEWVTDESMYSWVATQYLSLKTVLDWAVGGSQQESNIRYKPDAKDVFRYKMAKQVAGQDYLRAISKIDQAWACGTLAELEMLSIHYTNLTSRQDKKIQGKVKEYCAELIGLCRG